MEQFIVNQIKSGVKYLPANLVKSYFIPGADKKTKEMRKRGFICGVCHPNENYEQIKNANIGWIRIDIPFPFDKDGNIRENYTAFKNRCRGYVDNCIKVMAVTPYPQDYLEAGFDFRTKSGEEKTRETARFLINDLQGYIAGLQITNEMGMPRFTIPFTMEEAAKFIGIHLEEMSGLKKDVILGYNSAGPQADLHALMKPYLKYVDYVGIDIYIGCFYGAPGFMFMFDALVRFIWGMTGKPVLLQEFGYISDGKPKTRAEKNAILGKYGAKDEEDAKNNIEKFVDNMPKKFGEHIKFLARNDVNRYYDILFKSDITNHLYCELPVTTFVPGYEHTPKGQADFFRYIIPHLYNLDFVCGTIIYCYSDSDRCYVCGQSDCPTETRWGLVTRNGEPKPSYYAVQKIFWKIQNGMM